jgi:ATP-dependent helicase/nuclease subunit B
LQKMANNHFFQPKSPDAAIQVLGTLEAAGMPFDFLWAAGMDDLSWPPAPKPHPLLPKRLQRELNMPHATASRELHFCEAITQQFKDNAATIIFSHAEKLDELELQHSPLIKDVPLITKNNLELEDYLHPGYKIYQSKKLEMLLDEKAPPVNEDEKIYGGISVIQYQALCPFKSFSAWRLHAREMESPLPGLKAKDRGIVLHKILELIWKQLQTHAALMEMDEEILQGMIQESIEKALAASLHSHNEFKNYIQLEKKRLHQLVLEWLQFEKLRPPFKVIFHENVSQFKIGPLTLTIRIDRIDELENGKKLVIDYKTGKNNDVNNWFGERPEEPQLPFYALLDADNVCGITFAQIYPAGYVFKGVSHFALDIQGIKLISEIKKTTALSWKEQLQQWRLALTQLSHEFYHGEAKVNPKEGDQTCIWCALKPLCRINEEVC